MWQQQNIIITGGSSGLGLALACLLAARGARLGLIGRDRERLRRATAIIQEQTPAAFVAAAAVDVACESELADALSGLQGLLGGIDGLINSAGIDFEDYFELTPSTSFTQIMDINFFGTLHAIRAALPALKQSRGRIVNIASAAGLMGVFGYSAYAASKHAVVGLSDSLRYELKPQGVRVQLICPTEFDSPLVDALNAAGRSPENLAQALTIPKMPLPRMSALTLRAIESGRYLSVPGAGPALLVGLARLFPALARRLNDRTIAQHYAGPPLARTGSSS